jgi:hypothetical protein
MAGYLALYARVPTTDQNSEAQLHPLRSYAERRGLPALEYVDHGVSGIVGRPSTGLLAAARRRELAAVVVTLRFCVPRRCEGLAEDELGVEVSPGSSAPMAASSWSWRRAGTSAWGRRSATT